MKRQLVNGAVLAIALLVVLPCVAQDMALEGRDACGIEGTWYGANSAFINYIFRIEKNAGGGHTVVADGFPDMDVISYCLEYTAWHGELVKTGPDTFIFRQIELCDPNPDVFGPLPGLLLWAAEGQFTLADCTRVEASIPLVGAYLWGSGKVPFIDPFDIPFLAENAGEA